MKKHLFEIHDIIESFGCYFFVYQENKEINVVSIKSLKTGYSVPILNNDKNYTFFGKATKLTQRYDALLNDIFEEGISLKEMNLLSKDLSITCGEDAKIICFDNEFYIVEEVEY